MFPSTVITQCDLYTSPLLTQGAQLGCVRQERAQKNQTLTTEEDPRQQLYHLKIPDKSCMYHQTYSFKTQTYKSSTGLDATIKSPI